MKRFNQRYYGTGGTDGTNAAGGGGSVSDSSLASLESAMAANQAFQLQLAVLQQQDQMKQAANHAMQDSAKNIR